MSIEINTYNIIDNVNSISFENMLNNTYNLINIHKQNKLILPNMDVIINTNKLYWNNVYDFLKLINRNEDHFLNFLKYELNNKEINWISTLSIEDGLIIHEKFPKLNKIIEVRNKYISQYVICSSCNSYNTVLNKFIFKKYKFLCLNCNLSKCI